MFIQCRGCHRDRFAFTVLQLSYVWYLLSGVLQVVVGLGLVAAVGYALKQYAYPKVTQWYKEWRSDSEKEVAEQEAQKTAQLVASAIQAQVRNADFCSH